MTQGGLDAVGQASLFDLYNPERLKTPIEVKTSKALTWSEVDTAVKAALSAGSAGSVRVLTGPVLSPTTRRVIGQFVDQTKGSHHTAEDLPTDSMDRAMEIVSGRRFFPTLRFDQADVVVSVDADFLGSWIRPVEFTKQFSKRRKIHRGDANLNRLYVFESSHSVTGIAADLRSTISADAQLAVLQALGAEVVKARSSEGAASSYFGRYSATKLSQEFGFDLAVVQKAAKDLSDARGKSLVVAGGRGSQPLAVQLAALLLNAALGNFGTTLDTDRAMKLGTEGGESLSSLIEAMKAGRVQVLIVQGVNPAYSAGEAFREAVSKVPTVVTIVPSADETSALATWALPESHFLESWGDSEIREGVYTIQQPVIEPLYQSKSLGEILLSWMGTGSANFRDEVISYWQKNIAPAGDFKAWWNGQLKKGAFVSGAGGKPGIKWANALSRLERAASTKATGPVKFALYSPVALRDGSHANNPYLQELPDPITKVVWDNFVGVSPKMAARLGLNANHFNDAAREKPKVLASDFSSDVVQVSVNGKSFKLPVFVQTGLAEDTAVIALGYGRTHAGSLGTNVGQNAFSIASWDADGEVQLRGLSGTLTKTGETYELACTQKQFDLQGRDADVLHTYTLDEYKSGERAHKKPHVFSIYNDKEFVYPGQKWGMAVDLNSCTGCSACVVACYIENNVSTVGADQTRKGRHQAWLRLDLYHSGNAENPESNFETMMCQHCDKAPCETVCPVLATVHSSDGLNDMSYNRCVGTRYCANNCPYKVRRFNWFQYSDKLANAVTKEDPLPMMINPDVSVRTRGIMEKCTFCVQRIRSTVKDRMERIEDGSIKTACQQSCPADAIIFGDLNDPQSQVSQLAQAQSGFKVLEVLNTQPNVTYLPRIRNKESSV